MVASPCGAAIAGAWFLCSKFSGWKEGGVVDAMSVELGVVVEVADDRRKLHLLFSLGVVGWVEMGVRGVRSWVAIGG